MAEWEASGTNAAVSFPVGLTDIAFNLSVAKDQSGGFVVDAVATDGGYFPRNIAVPRTWAMVALGAITPLEMATKLSWNPSRMFGLLDKGHLSPRSRRRHNGRRPHHRQSPDEPGSQGSSPCWKAAPWPPAGTLLGNA